MSKGNYHGKTSEKMITRFRERFGKDIDNISDPDVLSAITDIIEIMAKGRNTLSQF